MIFKSKTHKMKIDYGPQQNSMAIRQYKIHVSEVTDRVSSMQENIQVAKLIFD